MLQHCASRSPSPFLSRIIPALACGYRIACAAGLLLLAATGTAGEPSVASSDLPRKPAVEPAQAISTFKIRPGIHVERAASEPLVVDPVAMCFDEDGRLFVAEMRDYSERRDERLGRIRLLEDRDGDGKFDHSTIFAEDLAWPTALFYWDGGLFVGSTPDILYFRDTNGDGKADERKTVFTGFGSQVKRLNVQQLFNSFTWGLDNRIYGAAGGNGGVIRSVAHPEYPPLDLGNSDFSFDPRTLEMRRETGGGQFGMSFDNAGRKFVTSNSAHLREVMYEYNWVRPEMRYALPSPTLDIPVDGPAAEVFRASPDEPWRVLRTRWRVAGLVPGPVEGGGRPSGYFTGASGVTIYRGTALGPDFSGDAFIADVGSNLVHRKKLLPNGVPFKAQRAPDEQHSEFLASTDNWFRPVTFANAPDGALYIIDMYREVIEHPWSLPANIKKYLDLNSGNDRGRIYRVVSPDFKQPPLPKLSHASTSDLISLLENPNGWYRDTAARLLYQRHDSASIADLRSFLNTTTSPLGRMHALYALKGLNALAPNDLSIAFNSSRSDSPGDSDLRQNVLRLMIGWPEMSETLQAILKSSLGSKSVRERYMAAWVLASVEIPGKTALLRTLGSEAEKDSADPWLRHAAFAAISTEPSLAAEFPEAFSQHTAKTSGKAAFHPTGYSSAPRAEIVQKYSAALKLTGDAAKGKTIYLERCSSCHRLAGQGTAVGPDLESVRAAGKETILGNLLDPNREIAKGFATYEVSGRNLDEPVVGILANDAPNGVTIRQASAVTTFVPRSDITNLRATGKSLMPEGLEAGLSMQDMANLLSYIAGQP
jgi:putative membrane-bound dehydrogenase-like protein